MQPEDVARILDLELAGEGHVQRVMVSVDQSRSGGGLVVTLICADGCYSELADAARGNRAVEWAGGLICSVKEILEDFYGHVTARIQFVGSGGVGCPLVLDSRGMPTP